MALRLKTAVRREQIAQAALEVLAESGLAELSMARIADRMGLATSAIYRHFPGKGEILDAVIDLIGSRLEANVAAASRASEKPLSRLEFLLLRHIALVRENSGIPRLLFSGEVFCSDGKRERLFRLISGYLARVAKIIRAGQRAGSIRTDIDAPTLAVHFLGIVQPAVMLGHLSDGRFDVARHAKRAWKLFVETAATR
ncbi:MAG: TetR/AcrR family transcriptional regulator [Candidatus Riflebacteria bacterium]|nr:TetR/AcrR family transcriptional regulator [Candidatus Riflebacteria bacterium]